MIVSIDGIFAAGARFARLRIVIESSLSDQVGAGGRMDFEPAGLEASRHRGNAGPQGIVSLADGKAAAAQLGNVAGPGRVSVPQDAARQPPGMFTEGQLSGVVLARQPEHVLGVARTPDGGERIAEAKVDAADRSAGKQRHGRDDAAGKIGINQSFQRFEGAAILLVIPGSAEGAQLLFEEGRADARDLAGPDLEAKPGSRGVMPGLEKESAAAKRGR
jgi:hypothetical protein